MSAPQEPEQQQQGDHDEKQQEPSLLLDYSAIGFLVLDTLCYPAGSTMPPKGGATFVQRIRMTPAGTAGGTAMVSGMLGIQGQLVASVCQDDAGEFLLHKLQQHGVQTNLITIQPVDDNTAVNNSINKLQTSCSMLPIQKTAERAAFFCPGTSSIFSINMEDSSLVAKVLNAKIIHLGGTGLLPQFDGAPSLQLVQKAKQLGRTVVFDLILANADTIPLVEPLLPYIDYFCPSIEEAAALAGFGNSSDNNKQSIKQNVSQIASFFKQKGVKNSILTMDRDGVYVDPEVGPAFTVPAHDIQVVDTTGCGDSFTAGIIVGLTRPEWNLHQTVKFANAVAAQVAQGLGSDGDGKLKSIQDTLHFMETTPYRNSSSASKIRSFNSN